MVRERERANCYDVLTFRKVADHGAVHGQTKGVAGLGGELLCVLRPLPAVPIRAEEKLVDIVGSTQKRSTFRGEAT